MTYAKPIIKKSCGIIPNRACLVIFGIIKLIADIITTVVLGYISLLILPYTSDSTIIWFVAVVFGIVLDIPFMIILIVGACKKSNHLFKISFQYSIISLVVALSLIFVLSILIFAIDFYNIGRDIYNSDLSDMENFMIHVAAVSSYALIHIYMILLMKSEITKTTNNGHVYNDQENMVDPKLNKTNQLSYNRFY